MTTLSHGLRTPTSTGAPTAPFTGHAMRLLALIEGWVDRRRQRWALLGLGDELLKDIGVSRADALREASKPFWRA